VTGQELDGDLARQVGIFGKVNFTHRAPAQLSDDSVMRDDPTYHLPPP
jgi:hypothetical protein